MNAMLGIFRINEVLRSRRTIDKGRIKNTLPFLPATLTPSVKHAQNHDKYVPNRVVNEPNDNMDGRKRQSTAEGLADTPRKHTADRISCEVGEGTNVKHAVCRMVTHPVTLGWNHLSMYLIFYSTPLDLVAGKRQSATMTWISLSHCVITCFSVWHVHVCGDAHGPKRSKLAK